MTPDEEKQFITKLADRFVLIPKDKWWHFIGGAVAFVVIATGLSVGGVVAYLRTEPAKRAQDHIVQIEKEADEAVKRIRQSDVRGNFTVVLDGSNTLPRPFGPASSSCFIPTKSDAAPLVSYAGSVSLPDINNMIVTTRQRSDTKGVYLRVDFRSTLPNGWKCYLNVFQPGVATDFKPDCIPYAAENGF